MADETLSFPLRCDHCQAQIESPLVCQACNALQPASDQADAFELLQLPASYRLQADRLEDVYLRLSRMIHPDYFGRGGAEKALSEELSARLNNAYRTLKDPLSRSEYLLKRAGGKSTDEDKRVAPALLAEVLELREQIEQARSAGRTEELDELNRELSQRSQAAFEALARLHDQLESAQAAGDQQRVGGLLDQIRLALNGIRYVQGLIRHSAT